MPAHYQFLKQLVREGLSSLFVAGTCAEYGLQAGALSEDMDPRPGHSYALAKHTLRLQLELLQSHMPFSLTWARLFFLYGDGQYHSALFSQLREAAESGAASFPMSGGEQLRDYLPVESVAELIVSLAVARRDFGCVNLCSGEPISVRRLVEGWIVENGWSITPELGVLAYPDYEPMACWGDRTRLDRCLSGTVPM